MCKRSFRVQIIPVVCTCRIVLHVPAICRAAHSLGPDRSVLHTVSCYAFAMRCPVLTSGTRRELSYNADSDSM
eukprot:1631150-Rhodomonas_salina.2